MGNKPPRKTSTGTKLLIAAALLLAVAAAQFFYLNWPGFANGSGQELRMTDTGKYVQYDFDVSTTFHCNDARFFYFCTKDGMKYVSSSGDLKWQEVFSLSKPIMVARGDIAAVGEAKGKYIYMFDASGLIFSVAFDDPVLYFSVNQAGYLAVILQLDKGYEIQAYSRRGGDEPIYRNIIRDPLFYPTAADISEDGKYMAIALLDLNVRMTSRAAFYYMNQQDAWSTEDGLFAYEEYRGQLVYHVRFMDNNNALVFTDEQIACYKPGEANTLDEQWVLPLHNKIEQPVFFKGSRFAYITGDKLLNDEAAAEPGEVNIYNLNGERTGVFTLGRKGTYMSMGHDSVIVGASRSFYALNYHGARIWEYIATQDTRQLIFLENTDTVLMAGASRAHILKRVKPKATEAPAENPEAGRDLEVID